jgi:hypothetical protein
MESTPKKRKLENDLNLNTPSPKRSHWELMKEKYDLIQASERISKPTQKDLASMFGVGKITVSDILKWKEFTRKTQHLNVKDMTRAVNTENWMT